MPILFFLQIASPAHSFIALWIRRWLLCSSPSSAQVFLWMKSFPQFSEKLSHYLCVCCVRSLLTNFRLLLLRDWNLFRLNGGFLVSSFFLVSLQPNVFSCCMLKKGVFMAVISGIFKNIISIVKWERYFYFRNNFL